MTGNDKGSQAGYDFSTQGAWDNASVSMVNCRDVVYNNLTGGPLMKTKRHDPNSAGHIGSYHKSFGKRRGGNYSMPVGVITNVLVIVTGGIVGALPVSYLWTNFIMPLMG